MATLPARHAHQARHPERAVGTEHLGIDEQIVDAAIDHVHTLEPVDRAHVHALVVADNEVDALDQRRADALREERVLEVRAVVDARREHRDGGLGDALRRE